MKKILTAFLAMVCMFILFMLPVRAEATVEWGQITLSKAGDKLSLLDAPGGETVETCLNGGTVTILKRDGDWMQVKLGVTEGWVPGQFIAHSATPYQQGEALHQGKVLSTAEEAVQVLSAPDSNGEVLYKWYNEFTFYILGETAEYYHVCRPEAGDGYLKKSDTIRMLPGTGKEEKSVIITAIEGAALRRTPENAGEALAQLMPGLTGFVQGEQDGWCFVVITMGNVEGFYGYVKTEDLNFSSWESDVRMAAMACDGKVYTASLPGARLLGTFPKGQEVTIYAKTSDKALVGALEARGWISLHALENQGLDAAVKTIELLGVGMIQTEKEWLPLYPYMGGDERSFLMKDGELVECFGTAKDTYLVRCQYASAVGFVEAQNMTLFPVENYSEGGTSKGRFDLAGNTTNVTGLPAGYYLFTPTSAKDHVTVTLANGETILHRGLQSSPYTFYLPMGAALTMEGNILLKDAPWKRPADVFAPGRYVVGAQIAAGVSTIAVSADLGKGLYRIITPDQDSGGGVYGPWQELNGEETILLNLSFGQILQLGVGLYIVTNGR